MMMLVFQNILISLKLLLNVYLRIFLDLWHSEFKNNTIFSFQDISNSTLKSQEAKLF